jgi:hypothetical protein
VASGSSAAPEDFRNVRRDTFIPGPFRRAPTFSTTNYIIP